LVKPLFGQAFPKSLTQSIYPVIFFTPVIMSE